MDDTNSTRIIASRCRDETAEAARVLKALGGDGVLEQKEEKYPAGEEEEDDFEIPQRFTKSGRKRAVSFPLKVCMDMERHVHYS